MKLVCSVSVGNRQLPVHGIKSNRKHVKSTLALCKHPNTKDFCLILFTGQDKTGTKYSLKGNISQILTRFVNDGKATIQFKAPPHDIFVQSEVIQLKGFLHLLKRVLENKVTDKEMSYSSMAVTPIKAKDVAPTKLVIAQRSDYPIKGFPRTLEVLRINDINRCSMDIGILQLTKLKVLDLSHNSIEYLPEDLNKLPSLRELNVSYNQLGKSTIRQWKWIGGNLSKTLQLLDLSNNKLVYLPNQIAKLHRLTTLKLNDNQLTSLPSGIGNLRNLQIFSASDNLLTSLPGSIKKWRLQSIDLSHNNFERNASNVPAGIFPKPLGVCSLKEYAAKRVLALKIPYPPGTLPATVADYLDQARFCVCGKACFDLYIQHSNNLILSNVAESICQSVNQTRHIPIDCYFCSLRCFSSSYYARNRNPII